MQIMVEVPEEFATQIIPPGKSPERLALELLALDGYRTGNLSEGQVRRMLGFDSRLEVHSLLNQHQIPLNYGVSAFEDDLETVKRLQSLRAAQTSCFPE